MKDNLITMSEIAETYRVRRATVWAWDQRRARNGFPMHKQFTLERRPRKLYSAREVQEWFDSYEPSKGGAPKGNTNWQGKQSKAVDG